MYGRYLRRELAGRKKQTAIVAIGLAIAIGLVIVVNALTTGVRDAQTQSLAAVYGVGTDLTVTGAAAEPGDGTGPRFEFDEDAGRATARPRPWSSRPCARTSAGRRSMPRCWTRWPVPTASPPRPVR